MTPTVNLSFRYTKKDITQAVRAHNISRLRLRLDLVVLIGASVLGVYEMRSAGIYWFGVGLVFLSAVFALILIAALFILPHMAFSRDPKYQDEYSLTFTPDGIHFRTVHIDSNLQWSMYSRAVVDSNSYVLYYGERYFSIIPKRVFQSIEHQKEFEQLLVEKIPNIQRKGN